MTISRRLRRGGLAAVAALPFVFQRPGYVAGQYVEWLRMLVGDDRKYWPIHVAYRDLWLLFRVTGMPMIPQMYQAIRAVIEAEKKSKTAERRGVPH